MVYIVQGEWEAEVAALRDAVERPVKELMSSHAHSSATHRAMLAGLPQLAAFFGREYVPSVSPFNDVVFVASTTPDSLNRPNVYMRTHARTHTHTNSFTALSLCF